MDNSAIQTDPALLAFARRFVRIRDHAEVEKRTASRDFFVEPITLWQVDEESERIGPSVCGVTRNYTNDGLGVFSDALLPAGCYRAQIHVPDRDIELSLRINWCEACGPYYFAGGPITKVYQ